ncbi:MAG: UDP-N-acetylmuramoyl-tripeptide--D-alanyl-D-alanine ligase, partial [Spirochaetales bacterium]
VDNTLHALQKAAAYYVRKFPNLKRIAVTGSSGKTTAKECIASVLSGHYNVIMNEGNLNSETGLPLSVFKITEKHEIGIFEMGMNRHGEIKELADVFFPEVAVITNIGTAHIGIFGTQDKIAEEKKQIFSNFVNNSVGFIFEDEPYYDFLVKNHNAKFYTYGEKTTGGISSVKNKGIHGSDIEYDSVTIAFPLAGEYNVQHACAAIAVGQYFSLCAEEIKHGLESVKPLFGRTQLLEGKPTIIQDCYNGNYESMTAALGFFSSIEWQAKKILVLGDMLELGEKSKEIHKKIAEHAILSPVHIIFFIGENFFDVMQKKDIDSHKKVFYTKNIDDESLKALIFSAGDIINPQDLVLIKGSRGISLERTVQMLRNAVKIYSEGKQ